MRIAIRAGVLVVLWVICAGAQTVGELRIKIVGPDNSGVAAQVRLQNAAKNIRKEVSTDRDGVLTLKGLPQGSYLLEVTAVGFGRNTEEIEVRNSIPVERHIRMSWSVTSTVDVVGNAELIDRSSPNRSERIDLESLDNGQKSSPGRGIANAVVAQPGWLMEANGVLHPRGSEYQVQYIVDGVPLTENRSVAFSAGSDDEELEAVTVRTGGYPAELGRKLGGVVEIETRRDARRGIHGRVDGSVGSFVTRELAADMQYGWKKSTLGWSAQGAATNRFLDPPALQNFSNRGTLGSFGARFDHAFTDRDDFGLAVQHQISRFLVPNEAVQEQADQRIARENLETSLIGSYRHIFSENSLVDVRGMWRDVNANMNSNAFSTPIQPTQDRGFGEGYFKAAVALHHGRNDWKAGVEYDRTRVHERFAYQVTDPSQFEPDTPPSLSFAERATGDEVGAFVQNGLRLGSWTASLGIRWDQYKLLANENAVSPRVGISKYIKALDMSVYASYDRAFQTPAIENLLLASSPAIAEIGPDVLRLPVRPSRGNFYEAGVTKAVANHVRLNASWFRRQMSQFADDDVLLNTGVSFPIAFAQASIYGAEGKVEIPRWNRFSGFVSYSYMVGRGSLPITGGLLLGDEVAQASQSGTFRISQDQRNTVHANMRYEIARSAWVGAGAWYGSGLPTELESDSVLENVSPVILRQVDLVRGRLRPSYSIDFSGGVTLFQKEKKSVRLQGDFENITDHLNVINFAGLFSGTAVGVPRSGHLSLRVEF
jgi:hypothetical protein